MEINMTEDRIFVAGHRGMVGAALVRQLISKGYPPKAILTRSKRELNLLDQRAVRAFFDNERPTQVYLAAARVGGIHANYTYPADFIYENLMIQTHVIEAAFRAGVHKLLFLGSSCIYPRLATQPMNEETLLTGELEPTNEPYAVAKIAGIKLCESFNRQYGVDYRSVMPTNLYGPGDNYHPENSHVVPALLRRYHDAKVNKAPAVTIWGSGKARREFLFVDDMAAACLFVMNLPKTKYDEETTPIRSHINIGFGQEIQILELARLIAQTVKYTGKTLLDPTKPDGAPRKLMDSERLNRLGWKPLTTLIEGLNRTYADFLEQNPS